ncbi:hypothetical protein ACQ4PT_035757 [Festuca glaucescens]
MSNCGSSWPSRKGRTQENTMPCIPEETNIRRHVPYANSHLFLQLNNIVQRFTHQQKDIAESSGFSAFAKEVHPLQFDKQFTVWLMPKVDNMARLVSVHVGRRITFFQEDAAKVFGIPCGGKDVWDASLDKSQDMRNKIQSIIGMDEDNTSPIKASEKTLRALAGRELIGDEVDVFKISFVVFVVCMIVDSNNPGEKESVNFWPALTNPQLIHTFNWSNYVLDAVFSACAASKMALRRNVPYNPPAGTTLFLQIFYLDNMDYGQISLPKGSRPRMELFDVRTLSKHDLTLGGAAQEASKTSFAEQSAGTDFTSTP